jgi:hypothetical protein
MAGGSANTTVEVTACGTLMLSVRSDGTRDGVVFDELTQQHDARASILVQP